MFIHMQTKMIVNVDTETNSLPLDMAMDSYHIRVQIKAPSEEYQQNKDNKKPLSLVVLGDISGSMASVDNQMSIMQRSFIARCNLYSTCNAVGKTPNKTPVATPINNVKSKMEQEKDTIKTIVRHLPTDSKIGIIAFDSEVTTIQMLGALPHNQKHALITKIDLDMYPRGATNIARALKEGKEQIELDNTDSVKAILLITDGDATNGPVSAAEIIASVGNMNCRVNCFGIGSDHKGDILNKIALNYGGSYNYLSTSEEIKSAVGACIGGLFSTYAENIEVSVNLGDLPVKKIKSGYPYISEGSTYIVKIPDLQAGETRDILFEVSLPQGYTHTVVGNVVVEYKRVGDGIIKTTSSIDIIRSTQPMAYNKSLGVQINRFMTSDALKDARHIATYDLPGAASKIEAAIEAIKQSPSSEYPECIDLIKDLEDSKKLMQNDNLYKNGGTNMLAAMSNAHYTQRASAYNNSGRTSQYATQQQMNTSQQYNSTGSINYVSI
jgi:uncharacterized protein YegL